MNILLTSVGRRAYMVKYFKEIIGDQGEVHVSNSDKNSIAFLYADKCVETPSIYDESYIPFLLKYCKENHIDILLSLFDIDLLVLAKSKSEFEKNGTKVIVSDVDIVSTCNDKWKTYQFLKENGFNTPKTFLNLESAEKAIADGDLCFPVVIKPRFACGSIAVSIAEDEEELKLFLKKANKQINRSYLKYESASSDERLLIQECLNGQEYGADVINDLNGNFCNTIVRKKIAMRSGETDIAEIVNEPSIQTELERLGKATGHIANLDCDIFLVDGVPYVLEMNARFGGGYPFSHAAGCNLPKAIVDWCCKKCIPNELLFARIGYKGFKELVITGS